MTTNPRIGGPAPDAFEIERRETCFRGFFQLDCFVVRHQRFDGGWTPLLRREVFLRGRAVALLPYDPLRDRVALVEQFRIGAAAAGRPAWLIEIPAGIIEQGEADEDVARREAKEEAGLELLDIEPITEFMPSPGGSSEVVSVLAARIDRQEVGGLFGVDHEGEDIRAHYPTADEAFEWVRSNRIDTSFSIIALQWLMLNRDRIRQAWLP